MAIGQELFIFCCNRVQQNSIFCWQDCFTRWLICFSHSFLLLITFVWGDKCGQLDICTCSTAPLLHELLLLVRSVLVTCNYLQVISASSSSSPLQSQMSFCQCLAQDTADGVGSARSWGLHWGASSHSARWDIVWTAPQPHVSSVC